MKDQLTLMAACVLCLGLAACGSSLPLAPEAPRFDGGHTLGSGNKYEDTATGTSTTETTVGDDTTEERGGFTAGSGN